LVNITDFPGGKECNYTTSLNESFWYVSVLGIPNRRWPRIFLPNAAANMKIRIQLANINNPLLMKYNNGAVAIHPQHDKLIT
jgi:hypothetical protein